LRGFWGARYGEFGSLDGPDPLREPLGIEGSIPLFRRRENVVCRNAFRRCRGHNDGAKRADHRVLRPTRATVLLNCGESLRERHGAVRLVQDEERVVADEAGVDRRDASTTSVAAEEEA